MMGEILSESRLWLLLLAQGTACLVLGLAGSYALKHHAARAHQILVIALLASVLMPASHVGVRHFELGLLTAQAPVARDPEAMPEPQPAVIPLLEERPVMEVEFGVTAAEIVPTDSVPPVRSASATRVPWRAILLACWATAVLILTARLAFRFVLGALLLRHAQGVDTVHMRQALDEASRRIGIRGSVDIRAHPNVRSPMIWCWRRTPTLLVPADTAQSTGPYDWAAVFCHELAHAKRRDHVVGLFSELMICLAPWHPLLWWARKKLLRFSEEACDDWVVAGGQIGVDYAESLLKLSPQETLALMPTVVGKEKTMKARIRRIVKGQCGNPRIGRCWALAVTVLILGLSVGIGFAQRRPLEREEIERCEQEQRELIVAGRRNVLERMLDQLVDQMHQTEAAMRERGDDPGPDGHVLRAELDALREHVESVERQLHNLDQRVGESDLSKRLELDRELSVQIERRLESMDNPDSEEARVLRTQLKELHEKMARQEEQLRHTRHARRTEGNARVDREARGTAESRQRAARARARAEDERMQDLTERVRELGRHEREIERNLERIDDKDSVEAQELRAALDKTHEEMAQISREQSRLRAEAARAAAARAARAGVTRAEAGVTRAEAGTGIARSVARSRRNDPDRKDRLRLAHEGMMAHIRITEDQLKEAEEQDRPETAERLRRILEQLHERRESLEREAQALNDAPRGRPQADPDMERQVEELRGKVDGIHQEMTEMREILQQILEQTHHEPPELVELSEPLPG